MQTLYVLYDSRCELCRRLKSWLQEQRQWLELRLVPAGSEEAKTLFPGLDQIASSEDLTVVGDDGSVYLNNRAWIMALWALEEYREWARRLAHPLLMPLARQAFDAVSKNRQVVSRWLAGSPVEIIAEELRTRSLEPCMPPRGTVSDYLR
jgi:predicted DCC family thiol-disulfide oxidoreductase YuxK